MGGAMAGDARSEILGAIRRANAADAAARRVAQDWEELPRSYRRTSAKDKAALVELLRDRLHDYDAQVLEVQASSGREAIAKTLTARGVQRVLVPGEFPGELLPEGFTFVPDDGMNAAEMNRCDGVLTQSTLAIAETGTIVLQSVAGQGKRATSLVPDYHLCLVNAALVVGTVPEAFDRLQATAKLPTTFISGPSATADIEMTRIKGVHGPRFLDVILFQS